MPVYNGEKYLKTAIQSVLDQTFTDFELVIADDGSFDGTESIIKSFSDTRIIHLKLPHRGIVQTLNDGIRSSCGEYIARMDADDEALPQRFMEQISCFKNDPDLTVCGSYVTTIDENGKETGTYSYSPESHRGIMAYLRRGNAFVHPTVMFRKEVFEKAGGYKKFLHAEDYELWTRMVPKGKACTITHPLLRYRVHASSITRKNRMRMRLTGVLVRILALWRTI